MNEPECYRVPLDRYPGMNRFVLDWLGGDERFLPRAPTRSNAAPPPSAPLIDALIASNKRWGLNIADEAQRWAAGKTQTIVAGQQVGFAGGPLYTFAKVASLLKMKRDNEARGISTTIFFWLATEDHDFAEAATIALPSRDPNRQQDLTWIRASRGRDSREVVGTLPIPQSLIDELTSRLEISRPKWLRPGITFADSFAELLTAAFDGGFILIDSLLPELRRAGAPLFEKIMKRWNDIQAALAARSKELEGAGYVPQIVPREDDAYTLLYRIDAHGNRQLMPKPAAVDAPEMISTSAITRPLLQDFVLRPDVFVGGPAEVAYYAQIAPLHRLLDISLPRVGLRGHVLVAPRRVVRSIGRFDIPPSDVFKTPDELSAAQESKGVAAVRSIAQEAEENLKKHIERIREIALPADHAVARSIHRSIGHIEYHFRKLTERAIRGLVRKDKDRFLALREVVSTLYPDRHVQDRVVAWLPFWCEHGKGLVERVVNEIEPDTATFKIVSL
ncbi:MAG: bacillithiol biosynthesis BshC [Acidobacteriota bacterium]|nr:bacillithiol biosynthesis BshC [Acidobacteriota bacterium]